MLFRSSIKNKDGDIKYIRYDGSQDIAKQLFQRLMSEISDPDTLDFEKPDSVVSKGSELYVKGKEPAKQQPDPEKNTEPDTSDQERSEEHTSELQSRGHLVCRLLLEKKKKRKNN